MRIINRKEFLALPKNIVFSYYDPCVFNGLFIKGESWTEDFLYDDLIAPIYSDNSDDLSDKCQLAEDGENIKLDFNYTGREGLFDDKQLFAIYTKEDVKQMIERLTLCQ
ncbi:MAG TPA: hypothetical protein DCR71_01330 [Dehalococcoidia bacterium]|nr:hypothetical protein [Dehalococcoidia bacterium]